MKQLLLLIVISFLSFELSAQNDGCVPNEMYRDSAVGVYPAPYDAITNPEGGITDTACVGSYYEFTFTFRIPEFINFGGVDIGIDTITVYDNGIGGLPEGFKYQCQPERIGGETSGSAKFTPLDTLACLRIYGTTNDDPGTYPLTISTNIKAGFLDQDFEFPNSTLPGADGQYNLVVEDAWTPGSTCFHVGVNDYLTENISISNSPNPFGSTTNIEISSKVDETLQFRVFDFLGNLVHNREIEIFQGSNSIEFDGTALANGIYTYSLSNQNANISKKMVISR